MSRIKFRSNMVVSVWLLFVVVGLLPTVQAGDDRALVREIFAELIAINTAPSGGDGQTRVAAQQMQARLLAAGFPVEDVQVLGSTNSLGNLVARYRSASPVRKPILMMAHIDVVEALPSDWSVPPFELLERDGYFYGRGSTDNKAGAAMLVANFIRLREQGYSPNRDLIIMLTADEETTGDSTMWLLDEHRGLLDAEFALNTDAGGVLLQDGEPRAFMMQTSEKIYASFRLSASNRGGHSSLPRIDNAIYNLLGALQSIAGYQFPVSLSDTTKTFFTRWEALVDDASKPIVNALAQGNLNRRKARQLVEHPYFNALSRTTCVATQLSGGHAENALPQTATATVNCRIVPQSSAQDVEAQLKRLIENTGVELSPIDLARPSPPSPLTPELINAFSEVAEKFWPDITLIPQMSTGATDGLFVRNAGIPVYGISAIAENSDDVRAHGRDERVGVDSFYTATDYWFKLIQHLAPHVADQMPPTSTLPVITPSKMEKTSQAESPATVADQAPSTSALPVITPSKMEKTSQVESPATEADQGPSTSALPVITPSNMEKTSQVKSPVTGADLVFKNGGVYTMNPVQPWAEAVAIKDSKIVFVGSNKAATQWEKDATHVIDLAGKLLLPGFHDAHVHPLMAGETLLGCALNTVTSVDAILAKLQSCNEATPDGWLIGRDFDLALFKNGNPHKSLLDDLFPDRPVYLTASDGHSVWVNSLALKLADIDASSEAPALGVIERDATTGEPTGTLRETAMGLISDLLPKATATENIAALKAALHEMSSFGITSFIDAWVGEDEWQAYQALELSNELNMRVVTSLTHGVFSDYDENEFEEVLARRDNYKSTLINTDSVKLFIDGVLEGETASLIEPYIGERKHYGVLNFEQSRLNEIVTRFDAMGLQVHMHALGDGGVRAGLDALQVARTRNGKTDNRHHLSHLQLIDPVDLPRFRDLGVAANFQALWAYPDAYITEINLPAVGAERVERMYPINSVYQAGGRLVGGSDWSVSSVNPLEAIEVAVRRADPHEKIKGELNINEAVSVATMLEAYTSNAAWLMHHEGITGSIELDKLADLVVLDRNILQIPTEQISQAHVEMTVFNGAIVYRAQ